MASHLAVLFFYLALTIIMTWPLAVSLGELVPFDLGDPLLSTWALWWNARELPFTAVWWDGPAFFPVHETLTLSDHRVGLGLITTPVIWFGASPLASHNVAFICSFVLSAMTAYALCLTLTGSRAAGLIGGLVFGFNPYRAGHLPHLELLASYWLPVALLALHQWAATTKDRWLVVLSVSLTMQALTSGYYFVFAGVLIGLWLVWFTPRALPLRAYARLSLALGLPLIFIAPVLFKFRAAHTRMGLFRDIQEIEQFSADAIGLITAPPPLAFWSSPESWQLPEQALMPGVTAVAVVVTAQILRRPPAPVDSPGWWTRLRTGVLVVAGGAAAAAMIPVLHGAVAFEVLGQRLSISDAFKPLSISTLLFWCWVLTTPRARDAWRRQLPLLFYVMATLAMWILALGPTARFLGERILYKAPYSWLMLLPGFRDEFRVPARFAMLAALTLSIAAALAFSQLAAGRTRRLTAAAACLIVAGVLLDSWIAPFPVVAAPHPLAVPPSVPQHAAILELPLGVYEDAIAMYHSMEHQRPTVNGMSGYEPPHYGVMRSALEEGRAEVIAELAAYSDIAIFVSRGAGGADLVNLRAALTSAKPLGATDTHDVMLLSHAPGASSRQLAHQAMVPVRRVTSSINPHDLHLMTDDDRLSTWSTLEPQRGGEAFTADLEDVVPITGITLSLGKSTTAFPRTIAVSVSVDGVRWAEAWQGDTAARTFSAAIVDPRDVTVLFPFTEQPARYVEVTQAGESTQPWAVAKFGVVGALTSTRQAP